MAPSSVRNVEVADGNSIATSTGACSTIAELISTLPQSFRLALGARLTAVYRVACKLCNVQNTIREYNRHEAAKTFPGSISNSLRKPKVQFCQEFLGTSEGKLVDSFLEDATRTARQSLFAAARKHKQEELAALQKLTVFNNQSWAQIAVDAAVRAAETCGGTFKVTLDTAGSAQPVWSEGIPATLRDDFAVVASHGNTWHYRAIAIARSLAERSLVEKTKNLSLKKDTDEQMRDVNTEAITRDVMRDEIALALKPLMQRLSSATPGESTLGKRRAPPLIDPAYRKRQVRSFQKEGRLEPLWRHQRAQEGESQGQEQGKERQMTVAAFVEQCSKDFRSWLPETYPPVYGTLSLESRMKIDAAFMRVWELDTHRAAKPGVFKHPDVTLPEDIEFMLAVNHKFILHQSPTQHDVGEAKSRFARTVRNRWFFRQKESQDFIPKFHVPSPTWNPPRASALIERGIREAEAVIDSQVNQALVTLASRPATRTLSSWAKVQDFLAENMLLAKLTDKNLGLAVFPIAWYDATVLSLLADAQAYAHVSDVPVTPLLQLLHKELPKWELPRQMEKYIQKATQQEIPEFHAIPKVHKEPWALRPIIPSHSWVTSTTSTVLDHLLQPILDELPWVASSSKEVITGIEECTPHGTAPIWIVTGDVVSFYTNIEPRQCSRVVAAAWKRFRSGSSITDKTIRRMVKFVMDNNFFSYRGQRFQQIKGLAMGTACAPTVANIYAAFYEHKSKVVHRDGVLLYKRYIDDILCLFQGTKEELSDFLHGFSLGTLEVKWSVSTIRNEFLDIELLRRSSNLRAVDTRLFRKQMNRHLYIPFSSAHPLHVKKGFVKAELSRYAIICSSIEYFAEARQEFYGNLRRRGYPPQMLDLWFQQVHYDNRPVLLLPKNKEEDRAPLMLSGHYNPVWDFINVKEVITAAREFWVQDGLPASLDEPLIRSLGRSKSLFDLLSTWNKTNLLHAPTVRLPGQVSTL